MCLTHRTKRLWLAALLLSLAAALLIATRTYPVSPGLIHNAAFPDKEVCSLGCAATWQTYTSPSLKATATGYAPTIGDVIEWQLTEPWWPTRLTGLWYASTRPAPITLRLAVNGQPRTTTPTRCSSQRICGVPLSQSIAVHTGDVIRVEVVHVAGSPVLSSLQPDGGH